MMSTSSVLQHSVAPVLAAWRIRRGTHTEKASVLRVTFDVKHSSASAAVAKAALCLSARGPLSSAGSSIGVTEINAWKLELQHRLGEETFPSGLLGFHLSLAHLRGSLPAQEIKRPGAGGGGGVSADRSQAPRPNRTRPEVSEVPSWLCAHRRVCACTPPLGHPGAGGQAAHRGRGTRDPSRDSGLRCIWQQAQRPLLGMSKALPGDS